MKIKINLKTPNLQHISPLGCGRKWHLIIFFHNSCQQQLTADKNFHPHPTSDMCANFQLSRLIFIFFSCQQLLSAVEHFLELNFHIGPKVGLCAKFQLDWLIGGQARECDAGHTPDGRKVKLGLTQALLLWCQGLSWAISWGVNFTSMSCDYLFINHPVPPTCHHVSLLHYFHWWQIIWLFVDFLILEQRYIDNCLCFLWWLRF